MTTTVENGSADAVVVGPDLSSTKSPLDKKNYRQILLPNGLRALLISDVTAMNQIQSEGGFLHDDAADEESEDADNNDQTKVDAIDDDEDDDDESEEGPSGLRDAAAAVVVGVGSYSDPFECQGMAHFLEHLLFMGSEAYPGENEYDVFMSKHGGCENAYTDSEVTNFHFSIPQEYLKGALDRLANFFIAPLLLENGVERELEAIESEYQLNKQNDHSRLHQLWSTTCQNPNHPFSRFQWGSKASLKEMPEKANVDPLERLREFFNKYYYASNMRLAIVGAYPLDDLQELVTKCFSAVPAFPRDGSTQSEGEAKPEISWSTSYSSPIAKFGLPFAPSSFKLYRIIPVKDRHNLSITWQMPPQLTKWKSKPCDYIAHLLGHEGEGSLLSAMKKKSWVTTCVAGLGGDGMENSSSHGLFTMTFTLSVAGVDYWPEVISYLYRYIGMLRYYGNKLPEWIYLELRSMHEFAYCYSDEPSPEDLVETLAEDMAPYKKLPPEHLLDGLHLLFAHDPSEIQEILDFFTPQNARIDFMSTSFGRPSDFESVSEASERKEVLDPSVKFDQREAGPPQVDPWFGTYYWVQEVPPQCLQEWSDLSRPQIPTKDSMLSLPPENLFVPTIFDLKPLPPDDANHALLNCSLKLCIVVGKKKQWFPGTVTKFNSLKNEILVSYEDEDEKWHKVDLQPSELSRSCDFESTLDAKKIKYRVVAVPQDGEGAIRKFGDDSDLDVMDGKSFPAIPPAKSPSRLPQLAVDSEVLKMWHLQDRYFHRPIAELRVAVFSASCNDSALHRACAELVVQLCHDALTETVYMASLCELGTTIESSESGFGFRVNGFDDKLLSLFETVFEKLLSFRGRTQEQGLPDGITEDRFAACLEMLQRKYENTGMEAQRLSSSVRVRCLCPGSWSASQRAEAIKDIDVSTFTQIAAALLLHIGVEAFYHGNVTKADAIQAGSLITDMLKATGGGVLSRKKFYYQNVTKVPDDQPKLLTIPSKDLEGPNTAVEAYFQMGKDNMQERVLSDMLVQLMHEPLYNQLRTKDQFGYRVSCDTRWTHGIMGMQFVVVTASKSAEATITRIEKFLTDFREDLVKMKAEDFIENQIALAKDKLDMFNCLSEETSSLWAEIRDCRFDWEVNRNEALCLRNITKDQVLEAFDKWLNPTNKGRRVLVVQVIAAENKDGTNTAASYGRPQVEQSQVGIYYDDQVRNFHDFCKNQIWGKVYMHKWS